LDHVDRAIVLDDHAVGISAWRTAAHVRHHVTFLMRSRGIGSRIHWPSRRTQAFIEWPARGATHAA
jgi:hypothetical protein